MATITLQRQFIHDLNGNPVGVILSLEEFALIKDVLEKRTTSPSLDPVAQMTQAANDPLFMADLHETMADFALVDEEGWEA